MTEPGEVSRPSVRPAGADGMPPMAKVCEEVVR